HHSRQGHHGSLFVADLELLQIFDLATKIRGRLHVNLPCAAEAVEIVDVQRTQINLQGVEHLEHVQAHAFGRSAVDVQKEPGRVGADAGKQVTQPGGCVAFVDDFFGNFLQ